MTEMIHILSGKSTEFVSVIFQFRAAFVVKQYHVISK